MKTLLSTIIALCLGSMVLAQEKYAALTNIDDPVDESDTKTIEGEKAPLPFSFMINDVGFNSKAVDIWPRPYANSLIITSNRKGKKSIGKYFHLYVVKKNDQGELVGRPRKVKGNLLSRFHDASPVFTKDGNVVYFTRNNANSLFFERAEGDISRLNIYKSIKKRKHWSKPEPLPFTDQSYSTAHPVLNEQENKLYFVSDMPGGYGGSDIYVIDIHEDGSYGTPVNLGGHINTEEDETSPYISSKGVLFFASKGHLGFGGLDLYAIDLDNGAENIPINLGEGINTPSDEFGLMIDASNNGYFSSNRGTKSNYDIYAFDMAGSLQPYLFGNGISVAQHTIEDEANTEISNDEPSEQNIAENVSGTSNDNDEGIAPADAVRAPLDSELVAYLSLNPILFEFDSDRLNQRARTTLSNIATYLTNFPSINIKVLGHTDRTGNQEYNKSLSLRRAKMVKIWLVQEGIGPQRINLRGMGEGHPLVHCDPCTANQMQKNRRAEVVVVD